MAQPPQAPPAYGAYPPYYSQPVYQQPPPGYNPAAMFTTQQSSQVVVVNNDNARHYPVGTCQRCGGHIGSYFTLMGIIMLIVFFPAGILCCLLMTEKRCDHCG
ncbi:hypothetical protein DPMN_015078 [Dreissena polymorpha]|uniref:Membrane protein BRI3 n=1 Tax=Dreissena polymorpha TaxID=45954 RepID=A0A9D4S5U7_DREPO|nr:hypothetical protein DPMN_015078 [Dreissena polymorpha]